MKLIPQDKCQLERNIIHIEIVCFFYVIAICANLRCGSNFFLSFKCLQNVALIGNAIQRNSTAVENLKSAVNQVINLFTKSRI